jgi:hypothetical protein
VGPGRLVAHAHVSCTGSSCGGDGEIHPWVKKTVLEHGGDLEGQKIL